MDNARDHLLRSLQGSVNMLDANDAVMRASIDQLASMIRDLSARLHRLETDPMVEEMSAAESLGVIDRSP